MLNASILYAPSLVIRGTPFPQAHRKINTYLFRLVGFIYKPLMCGLNF